MTDLAEKTLSAQNRIVFLDYLRVVACFMVMAIHSAEPFYHGGDHVYGLGLPCASFAQDTRRREMDLLKTMGIIIRPLMTRNMIYHNDFNLGLGDCFKPQRTGETGV